MFWTRQVVFSVTRNIFRNAKQLARKGVENSSEVVVFYRAPRVPRPIFKRSTGPRHFHSKLAPQSLVFAHYRTQKRGKSCKDLPRKRLDSIQFFENKTPDLQFSFGSSERFLKIRLHKIGHYNTCFSAILFPKVPSKRALKLAQSIGQIFALNAPYKSLSENVRHKIYIHFHRVAQDPIGSSHKVYLSG